MHGHMTLIDMLIPNLPSLIEDAHVMGMLGQFTDNSVCIIQGIIILEIKK